MTPVRRSLRRPVRSDGPARPDGHRLSRRHQQCPPAEGVADYAGVLGRDPSVSFTVANDSGEPVCRRYLHRAVASHRRVLPELPERLFQRQRYLRAKGRRPARQLQSREVRPLAACRSCWSSAGRRESPRANSSVPEREIRISRSGRLIAFPLQLLLALEGEVAERIVDVGQHHAVDLEP